MSVSIDRSKKQIAELEVKERLLLMAERLFGENGFEAVSLREVTREAGANVASVNYYFGSKEGLIDAIILNHIKPCCEERLRMLEELRVKYGSEAISVPELVRAFLEPMFTEVGERKETRKIFAKIMSRLTTEKGHAVPEEALPFFEKVMKNFVWEFKKSLPDLSREDIITRMHFSVGVFVHAMTQEETIKTISGGQIGKASAKQTFEKILRYCAGGFSAVILAMMSLGLSGCQSLPPASEMSQVVGMAPKDWTASRAAQAGMDDGWIRRLGDRRIAALASEAVQNQPSLKVASEKVKQAGYAATLAGVPMNPTAGIGLQGQRQRTVFLGIPGVNGQEFDSYGVSLDAQWELDVWGRIRMGQSATIGEWQAAAYDRRAAEVSLAGQVSKGWFQLAEANDQLKLAQESHQLTRDTENLIRGRYESALDDFGGSVAQLRSATTQVESAQAVIEQRKGAVDSAARQLELLLGRYPSGLLREASLAQSKLATVPSGLPSELLLRRPDILSAERRFAASGARLKEARLAVYPRLILTGSAGTTTDQLKSILDSSFGVWSLGANLAQSILTGGQLKAEARLRESVQRENLATLQKTVIDAFGEVEVALAQEQSIRRQLSAVNRAVKVAGEAVSASSEDYREGTGDVLDLLGNQSQLISLRSQRLSLKHALYSNRVSLHLALGGDFKIRGK